MLWYVTFLLTCFVFVCQTCFRWSLSRLVKTSGGPPRVAEKALNKTHQLSVEGWLEKCWAFSSCSMFMWGHICCKCLWLTTGRDGDIGHALIFAPTYSSDEESLFQKVIFIMNYLLCLIPCSWKHFNQPGFWFQIISDKSESAKLHLIPIENEKWKLLLFVPKEKFQLVSRPWEPAIQPLIFQNQTYFFLLQKVKV